LETGNPACKDLASTVPNGSSLEIFRGPGLTWSDLWKLNKTESSSRTGSSSSRFLEGTKQKDLTTGSDPNMMQIGRLPFQLY